MAKEKKSDLFSTSDLLELDIILLSSSSLLRNVNVMKKQKIFENEYDGMDMHEACLNIIKKVKNAKLSLVKEVEKTDEAKTE